VTPRIPAEFHRRYGGTYCLHLLGPDSCYCAFDLFFVPEVGGSTFHRNVGELLPDYKVSHPSLPWDPQIPHAVMLFNNIRLSFCLSTKKLKNKMADNKRLRASLACYRRPFLGHVSYVSTRSTCSLSRTRKLGERANEEYWYTNSEITGPGGKEVKGFFCHI
jgi:hypothetical protein